MFFLNALTSASVLTLGSFGIPRNIKVVSHVLLPTFGAFQISLLFNYPCNEQATKNSFSPMSFSQPCFQFPAVAVWPTPSWSFSTNFISYAIHTWFFDVPSPTAENYRPFDLISPTVACEFIYPLTPRTATFILLSPLSIKIG